MPRQEKQGLCFVIAPIGEEGSEVRRRSDQVLKHIIAPAALDCGYETIRADKISEPGIITTQVIQHLMEDALVIADLTGRNPNVFYELAIRHAIMKPVVQIIQIGDPIPFDVAQSRTIQVDHHDLDSAENCRGELIRQIRAVEKNPADVDTPISVAINLQSLRQSGNPLEKSSAEIISMLQDLRALLHDKAGERLNKNLEEMRTYAKNLDGAYASLKTSCLGVCKKIMLMTESRDPYSLGHCERVGRICGNMAQAMKLSREDINTVLLAAMFHDIGKVAIPDSILLAAGPLDPQESAQIQLHPTKSSEILGSFAFMEKALPIIEAHHEAWDGDGYPLGLKGEQIPLGARILAVADAYDAMTTARPYRPPFSTNEAVKRLQEGTGSHWDPKAVEAFLTIKARIDEGETGSL